MIDQPRAAEPLDAASERRDGDRIARHRDRHVRDGALAEVPEVGSGPKHAGYDAGTGGYALRNEIGCALRMTHFVRRDEPEQLGEDWLRGLLGKSAEEVGRQVLGEHELDEAFDKV